MRSKEEIQKEYDNLYRIKPNRWSNIDRSVFMIKVLNKVLPNPKYVIDIGCGSGITLENYRFYNKTAELYGIDFSEEALKLAKERVPDGNFTTENEFKGRKKFDLVICMGTAEHVEELLEFLKSLKARLKKDGICYFEVPNNLSYSSGPETYRRLKTRSQQYEWHFPLKKWEDILIQAGFEIIEKIKGNNPTWEFIWLLK